MNTTFLGNPLIAELLANPSKFKQDGRAYQLLEEYFSGLSVDTLRPLLRHEDSLVRHAAVWVASELGDQASALLDDATPLIESNDRFQSYHALEIAAVCAIGPQVDRFVNVARGLESGDGVIRGLTMRLMSRADPSQLEAAAVASERDPACPEAHKRGLWLLAKGEQADSRDVRELLASDNRLALCYGAIAAKRLREKCPELLEHATTLPDATVSKFASEAA